MMIHGNPLESNTWTVMELYGVVWMPLATHGVAWTSAELF